MPPRVAYPPAQLDHKTFGSRAAFSGEPHIRSGAIAVWFTSPAGVVIQLVEPARCTVEMANWLVAAVDAELERRFARANGLIFVFDLALMQGRTHAARSAFLGKVRQSGKRFSEAFFVPPHVASPALKHSMHASVLLARTLGIKVELVDSSERAVVLRGLRTLP